MKTLVLCNGRPPRPDLFMEVYAWSDYFIAADGGGNTARVFDRLPDIVVGDLDSFNPHPDDTFQVTRDPDQETNDLEKALTIAQAKQASEVVVLGATGRRVDQTLKNLSVLRQFSPYFQQLTIKDEFNEMFLLPKTFTIDLPVGTKVSLFPLSGVVNGICTKELKYSLSNESLENGVRDGSSNEVVGSPVTITHCEGDLIFIIIKERY